MAATSENILVFGGTGFIGQPITEALIAAKPAFNRLGIFTSSATVDTKASYIQLLKENGVEVIVGDIKSEADILKAYSGFDTVVSAVGRNAIAEQINLIRLAEQTPNIKRFFPSEYGTDIEYGPQSANEKPHQQKLKVRKYFKDEVKRLQYTYIVTGPYADGYISKNGGFNVEEQTAKLLGSGKEKVAMTTMSEYVLTFSLLLAGYADIYVSVGKLLVAAVQNPEASLNRALIVNSFTTTPDEIVEEFSRQTDSKWKVSYMPLDELKKAEQQAWEKGGAMGYRLHFEAYLDRGRYAVRITGQRGDWIHEAGHAGRCSRKCHSGPGPK